MFRNLLKPGSGLMITMTQITDCIFLSLFWLLGCIPVVTVGASLAALYDAAYQGFRKGNKHCWHRFLNTYMQNLKAGLVPSLVFWAVFLLLTRTLICLWNRAVFGEISWMLFSGAALVGMVVVGILFLVFPILSRFENPTALLLKNAVFMGMANLPGVLALGILCAGTVLVCMFYVFPLFFLPCLSALVGTVLIEPMFKPYMPEEPEETE